MTLGTVNASLATLTHTHIQADTDTDTVALDYANKQKGREREKDKTGIKLMDRQTDKQTFVYLAYHTPRCTARTL